MQPPRIEYPIQVDWNATPTEQLPRLPGVVGPAPIQATIEPPASEAPTEVFERVVFPPVVEEQGRFAGWTRNRLYTRARKLKIPGRSRMNKEQLKAAIILKENIED
jgi:hypothetical protein